MRGREAAGFTLIEVLVALAVVAMGLAALMTAVSSTANSSGYLRQKAQAQWIALNHLIEVRLNLQNTGLGTSSGSGLSLGGTNSPSASSSLGSAASSSLGSGTSSGGDAGELDFANQHWHYDTQYFDTSIATMRRVVVRVYAGTADTKGPAIAEATGFIGTAVAVAGSSNSVDWTSGSVPTSTGASANTNAKTGATLPPAGSAAAAGFGTLGGSSSLGSSSTLGDSSSSDDSSGQESGTSPNNGNATPDQSSGTGLN